MQLNLAKTVLLPLWTWERETAAAAWGQAVPAWQGVRVAYSGTYLGFEVGPAAGDTGWRAPVRKFREAVCGWVGRAPGMHLATLAYNTFAISKLQYVAQLHGMPPDWARLERWAVQRLYPGPARWLPAAVAHSLRDEFGMPSQLQTLSTSGPAAQLRVAWAGGDHRRRMRLDRTARLLDEARRRTLAHDIEWRWTSWFDGGPVQRLRASVQDMERQGISERVVLEQGLGTGPSPATRKAWQRAQRRMQSSATALLRHRGWLRSGLAQFDGKLRKWRVQGLLPGLRAARSGRVMKTLPKSTPPRVRAAVLRSWLGGWCTGRRFGRRGGPVRSAAGTARTRSPTTSAAPASGVLGWPSWAWPTRARRMSAH